MAAVIEVRNLAKDFGNGIKAVDDLSFTVPGGQVYGFLGQNGAGKSTTIRILLSLVRPDNGSIRIFGQDLHLYRKEILKRTGAMIEKPDLYKYLTALENLRIFGAMSGVRLSKKTLIQHLDRVGLAARANHKVKTYSQGMKQRLGIAIALVHDPELVVLDEPANGLDPQGIAEVRGLIRHLTKDLHKTLLVSSHLLVEMEQLADSMLIIDKGKKIVEGRTGELLNPLIVRIEIESDNMGKAYEVLKNSTWHAGLVGDGAALVLELPRSNIPDLNRLLVQEQVNVYALKTKHSLEDYFLSLTSN